MPAQPSQVTYLDHQSDQHQEYIAHQLLQVSQALQHFSLIMADHIQQSTGDVAESNAKQVRWTAQEEIALVRYLVEHKAERGDGNFKDSTLNAALNHIKDLRVTGKEKDLKSVQNKWSSIKAIFMAIVAYRKQSGVHWDNISGANIIGDAAASVFEEYLAHNSKAHKCMKRFRNEGWPLLEMMEEIYPNASATGRYVYRPSTAVPAPTSTAPATPAAPAVPTIPASSIVPTNPAIQVPTATVAGVGQMDEITDGSSINIDPILLMESMDASSSASPAAVSTPVSSFSGRNKRPFSVVSPDESSLSHGQSLLFSPDIQASSYSVPPSSRQSSKRGRATPKEDQSSTVAMNMVNNSIRNLTDSISTILPNKLSIIKDAGQALYDIPGLSTNAIVKIGAHFTQHEVKASFFLSLKTKERIVYIQCLCAELGVMAGASYDGDTEIG